LEAKLEVLVLFFFLVAEVVKAMALNSPLCAALYSMTVSTLYLVRLNGGHLSPHDSAGHFEIESPSEPLQLVVDLRTRKMMICRSSEHAFLTCSHAFL